MNEERIDGESIGIGPEAFSDPFEAPQELEEFVEVTDGLNVRHELPGHTVGEVRSKLAVPLNLDPEAQALIDNEPVGDDTILQAGQSLTFLGPAGEKGVSSPTISDWQPPRPVQRGGHWRKWPCATV
jgi:hypothetical protein